MASLSFVSFETGDILYLTGAAKNLVGPEASALMPRHNVLTTVYVTGYVFIKGCLPIRQIPGSEVTRSPYSPPIKLLKEEIPEGSQMFDDGGVGVSLVRIEIHGEDLATFTWETDKEVEIEPGQTAVLDFTKLVGKAEYNHMAAWKPSAVNDDRIRTWTISSAHVAGTEAKGAKAKMKGKTKTFALTMREKPGGAVTGALFAIARKLAELKPEFLKDTRPLELNVGLVGIAGEFTLPSSPTSHSYLWIAGGIGLTPFISMIAALTSAGGGSAGAEEDPERPITIDLILSTREPDVLLPLVYRAFVAPTPGASIHPIRLGVHVFTIQPISDLAPSVPSPHTVTLRAYPGRVPDSFFQTTFGDLGSADGRREVYLCGSGPFEEAALSALGNAGVQKNDVTREGFAY